MRSKFSTVLLVLAICVLWATSPLLAEGAEIGTPTATQTVNGVIYNQYQFSYGSSRQVMFTGEYKPTEDSDYKFVVHDVRNSSGATVLTTVEQIANDYMQKTGEKVVLATNGDFFYNTGGCVDSLVKDGIVYQQGAMSNKNAFGFDNDGNTAIGRMTETSNVIILNVKGKSYRYDIDKINKAPEDGEVALFTSATNLTVNGAAKYKFSTQSTNVLQFPTEGKSSRMVTGTVVDDKALSLVSGEFAIVIKGENQISQFFFDNVIYGVECTLAKIPAGVYEGMQWVVGGYDALVKNGTVNTSPHTDNSGDASAPRTFIGAKSDGTIMLGVIDGRQAGYSIGVTVKAEAEIASSLGLVNALELDGGGSSTFMFDGGNGLKLLNKPSDGAQRRVSNAILLVQKIKQEQPIDPPEDSSSGESQGGAQSSGSSEGNQDGFNCKTSITSDLAPLTALLAVALVGITKKSKIGGKR